MISLVQQTQPLCDCKALRPTAYGEERLARFYVTEDYETKTIMLVRERTQIPGHSLWKRHQIISCILAGGIYKPRGILLEELEPHVGQSICGHLTDVCGSNESLE